MAQTCMSAYTADFSLTVANLDLTSFGTKSTQSKNKKAVIEKQFGKKALKK